MEISIVTSVYRDGYFAREFCDLVIGVLSHELGISGQVLADAVEIIFVNDGSPDDSLSHLLDVQKSFPCVKVVDLSRNFGQHEALACGFRLATGRLVVRMNIDMQDHPTELPKLLQIARRGNYDLVVGRYQDRKSPLSSRISAYIYFELFKFLTGFEVLQRTSPMRVMSRSFIDAYNALTEKSRFPQGLDCWLGFRSTYVEIEHRPRQRGKSSYNFHSRARLALLGMLYFSDRPLKLIGYFGLLISLIGGALGMGIIIQKIAGGDYLPGYASLAAIALVGMGLQIGCIGVAGLYIGRIFCEVQGRPLYIVREIYRRRPEN